MKNDKYKNKLDYVQGGNGQVSVKVNVDISTYAGRVNLGYGGPRTNEQEMMQVENNQIENFESNNTFKFNSTNYKPQCK